MLDEVVEKLKKKRKEKPTIAPKKTEVQAASLAEVVEKVKKNTKKPTIAPKKTEVQAASPAHCYAGPGDVECDFCTGRKHKAVKSCLMCDASLCETHLKPHLERPALKNHTLVEVTTKLPEKICSEHDRPMEIYCRTDQRFICSFCLLDKHKGHDAGLSKAESSEKQRELKEEQMKSQQRIQEKQKKRELKEERRRSQQSINEKQKKVQELKQAVNTIKLSTQTAVEDSEIIFTEMISSMEKRRSEVTELIRAQEKAELSRAERLLEQLEQEIADLQRRVTELEELSHTDDHPNILQDLASGHLKKRLEEFCEEFNKLLPHVNVPVYLFSDPQSREEFLRYSRALTLDPNTAHHNLILSENNRVERVAVRTAFSVTQRDSEEIFPPAF
ncbi:hypothetical protein AMELA_G00015810 [Ameiurus melas]|uniref:B box-type domain-containing protein n=1 Tax=Ameiurus melas TaxID=219545 RepID=A0A7J6BC98_AMEME|nr:hypothetical protein AMELA_G00015810 [Ameiurus melas]